MHVCQFAICVKLPAANSSGLVKSRSSHDAHGRLTPAVRTQHSGTGKMSSCCQAWPGVSHTWSLFLGDTWQLLNSAASTLFLHKQTRTCRRGHRANNLAHNMHWITLDVYNRSKRLLLMICFPKLLSASLLVVQGCTKRFRHGHSSLPMGARSAFCRTKHVRATETSAY